MREELIILLQEAFENGIVTSTIQSQIEAIKKKIKMTDAEYQYIEDEIRLDAYIQKVQDREKKGITFMGDLRKQYKITEDDKIIIQEKLKSVPKKSGSAKTPEAGSHSAEPKKQQPAVHIPEAKKTEAAKKTEHHKYTEPVAAMKPSQSSPPSPQSEAMKRSELLKQRTTNRVPETAALPETLKYQNPPPQPVPSRRASGKKTLILVADDNETQLFLTKSILEENYYECITAETPEAAVKCITEQHPDLIFCDINFGIGKPTGLDVFTNIRSKNIRVPFIIVSAFIQKEFKDHARRLGVTEYITKPADLTQLIAVIKKYIPA